MKARNTSNASWLGYSSLPSSFSAARAASRASFFSTASLASRRRRGSSSCFFAKISRLALSERQTQELMRLMEAVNDLENIGDVVESNLVVLGNERIDQGVSISAPTPEILIGFQEAVTRSVWAAVQAVAQKNEVAAHLVTAMKQEIGAIAESAAAHEARRLVAAEPNRIPTYTLEIDIIEKQKRIYYFAKRMAKTVETEQAEESE